MGNLFDRWKESVVTVYDSQELTTLELLEDVTSFNEELAKGIDDLDLKIDTRLKSKTDLNGDHKGSWQGLTRPTLSEEGMRATVEKLNTEIPKLENDIDIVNSQLEQNKNELTNKINEVATKGTTTEVLQNTTETYIQKKIDDGTIANLTIQKNSITSDRIDKSFANKILGITVRDLTIQNSKIIENGTSATTSTISRSDFIKLDDFYSFLEVEGLKKTTSINAINFYSNNDFNSWISGNLLSRESIGKEYIYIPKNAKYFIIQQNKSDIINDDLKIKYAGVTSIISTNELKNKRKITLDGKVNTNTSSIHSSDFIDVENVNKILISGAITSSDLNLVNYYSDKDYNSWISGDVLGDGYKNNIESYVPTNAKYMIIQDYDRNINYCNCYFNKLTLSIFEKEVKNITTNDVYKSLLLKNKTVVSDINSFTCGSAPNSVIDDKGNVYFVYLASRTKFGEQRDIVALGKYNIMTPNNVEHFIVCEEGVAINGKSYLQPYEPNITILPDGTIRCYFIPATSMWVMDKYKFRDFNPIDNTFSDVKDCKLNIDNEVGNMTQSRLKTYITTKGGTVTGATTDLIFTSRIVVKEGIYYGALTCRKQNPVIIKSSDCETWEVVGIIPNVSEFECQLDFIGENLYAILRNVTTNIYKSTDKGITWSATNSKFSLTGTRPQVISYKDGLLLLHSDFSSDKKYNTLNYFNGGRHNLKIEYITETDNDIFIDNKLFLESKYGIVYYSVLNHLDDIFIIFSDCERFKDKQGKDCLYSLKLGEFYKNADFSLE